MIARAWLAPIGLFLFQIAPAGVVQDEGGRYRFAVGGDFGSYEEQRLDCSGNVTARERFKFTTVGGEADAWIAPNVRLTAHAGNISASRSSGEVLADPFEGFFGGVMAVGEDRKIGIGVGVATAPTGSMSYDGGSLRSHAVRPMFALRIGRRDGLQFQTEWGGTPAPGAPPELGRIGVGHPDASGGHPGWRLDLGVSDFPRNDGPKATIDWQMRYRVGRRGEIGGILSYREPMGGSLGLFGGMTLGPSRRNAVQNP